MKAERDELPRIGSGSERTNCPEPLKTTPKTKWMTVPEALAEPIPAAIPDPSVSLTWNVPRPETYPVEI
jgi:hypothetical protein